ncbi:tRNA lysidine(34) synthetase TilS [Pseudomonas sp.]|uniref:tRNA lysidine(34) synthetase TilS n=1 Tax=Pseudomonas sp. TaxID=306 RepID=UPI002630FA23|nr:tRNA lysidine(34) synthetase TilS [Pseudomonas sp.]
MPNLSTQLLQALGPWRNAKAWHVALSGGLDSTVLLHLLAHLRQTHSLPSLTAVHVHHGLQTAAEAWPAHCQALCDALDVPLQVVHVQVHRGASLERAAREARYQVFEAVTQSQDVLLTGQHRDDQAETVLFRLMRGAGVSGLAAMPRERALGQGHLCRPLLGVSRAELEAYARAQALSWVEDPSNTLTDFSRNYLRHEVFPRLTQRWPQAAASMARSAAHCAEAQGLLDELAQQDLQGADAVSDFAWLGLPSLALTPLTRLSLPRQRNALRHWLAPLTQLPDTDHWVGWGTLRDARQDAQPTWCLGNGELHRAQERIWWLSGDWLQPPPTPQTWEQPDQPLVLPGNGRVWLSGEIPTGPLQVSYRQGGEVMALASRGHRDLKRLLNEQGVPLFARGRLPLLYGDGQLLAVANLDGLAYGPCGRWKFHWLPTSSDQGLS